MENPCSANIYEPSPWSFDFVQSLKVDHLLMHEDMCESLEAEVKKIIDSRDTDPLALLELIDNIQRLGLGYRFEKSERKALNMRTLCTDTEEMNLHWISLNFRLMRQNGYEISQDVFKHFMNKHGDFKESLCKDIKGMLSLYEATYLSIEGEEILSEAQKFTTKQLNDYAENTTLSQSKQVRHALELPLHRRMVRLEIREHIDSYRERKDTNQALLKLAELDFNRVQLVLMDELQDISRWWNHTGVSKKLSFVRDRIMESYFCSVGLVPNPQYSMCRKGLTKIIALVTSIDDVYDEYGSFEQLEIFTQAVERWNLDDANALPECMILAFKILQDTVNEVAYDNYKEQGINTLPNLRKVWADLCKSFLLEAKWEHSKHQPSFKEYIDNAWVSSTVAVLLVHAYCLVSTSITKEALHCFDNYHDILRYPSMILRLLNDLSSSSDDMYGENIAKSIPCYVKDFNVSVEVAQRNIRSLIDVMWEKMNKDIQGGGTIFNRAFIDIVLNLARTSHCVFKDGDAHKAPNNASKKQVLKVLIEPIA